LAKKKNGKDRKTDLFVEEVLEIDRNEMRYLEILAFQSNPYGE